MALRNMSISLVQSRKRTARESDNIESITAIPEGAAQKKTRLDDSSHEMTMRRLIRQMDALCLADAHKEVLDTYELLEQILLHLPIKDLFVLQRTCSKWRKLITESHALQKRMFLRPQSAVVRPLYYDRLTRYKGPMKLNPALSFHAHHDLLPNEAGSWMPDIYSERRSFGQGWVMNLENKWSPALITTVDLHTLLHCGDDPPDPCDLPSVGSYREEASWKQMLITSPPVPAAVVDIEVKNWEREKDGEHGLPEQLTIFNPLGLRFEDMVNLRRVLKERLRPTGIDVERLIFTPTLDLDDAEILVAEKGPCVWEAEGEANSARLDDIGGVESLPGSASTKKPKLQQTQQELALEQLGRRLDVLCLADAHHEVLDTYELLEQILLQLPIKDLFVLQRTCKKWQKVIGESHALQRKMFLRPDGMAKHPISNPTHAGHEGAVYQGVVRLNPASSFTVDHDEEPNSSVTSKHRSFADIEIMKDWAYTGAAWVKINFLDGYDNVHDYNLSMSSGIHRGEASWRRMLITRPPVKSVFVWASCRNHGQVGDDFDMVLYNPDGVTFGDVSTARQNIMREVYWQKSKTNSQLTVCVTTLAFTTESELHGLLKSCKGDLNHDGECACLRRLQSD